MPSPDLDRSRRFADIDAEIADQEEKIADCRRAVVASRVVAIGGAATLAAALTLVSSLLTPTIVFAAVAAIIGGLVWGGASRSSMMDANVRLKELLDAKGREFDAVAVANGWLRSDTLH